MNLNQQLLILDGERLWRRITEVEDLPGGLQRGRVAIRGVVYAVERQWPTGDPVWRPVDSPTTPEKTLVELWALDDDDDDNDWSDDSWEAELEREGNDYDRERMEW